MAKGKSIHIEGEADKVTRVERDELADLIINAANTPQAQFIANLQSRIYSQLAQQLTNSIFGGTGNPTCTTPGTVCGTIPDLGGNTVTWGLGSGSNNGMILINITNNSNPSQTTQISVPAGTFYF